jgi:hypothetical protein
MRVFEAMHPGAQVPYFATPHPNVYFDESMKYFAAKDAPAQT